MRWIAILLVVACAPKAARQKDPVITALAAADRQWAQRSTVGIDAAEMAYTTLLARWPGEPRVWGRLARTAWSRALVNPADARAWHEAGREQAMRCLLRDGRLEEAVIRGGDHLDDDVLEGIKGRDSACLVYAAAHTVMLVRLRGEGAMLDLGDVPPLVARAEALGEAEPALRRWTAASELMIRGAEPSRARVLHAEAVALAPGQAFYAAEALRAFPDLAGTLPDSVPDTEWQIENAAVNATFSISDGRNGVGATGD